MLGKYSNFIKEFKNSGYSDIFFNQISNQKGQLIIRHDIDYDCDYALDIAKIENSLGIKSTFFFMLNNPIYNIFSKKNASSIKKILDLGHKVSIHLDLEDGKIRREIELFESYFSLKINIVSIHRPNFNKFDINKPIVINQNRYIDHTYMDKYFKNIAYMSDSKGEFGYGHPIESEAYKNLKSIQLLIHPAWWMSEENTPIKIMQGVIKKNNELNKSFFNDNSLVFRESKK